MTGYMFYRSPRMSQANFGILPSTPNTQGIALEMHYNNNYGNRQLSCILERRKQETLQRRSYRKGSKAFMLLVRLDYVILVSCPLSHRLPGVINFIIIIILPSTIHDSTTTMAPNLAVSTHELTQNIINSKLQGDQGPTDDQTAKVACCSARAIRRHRTERPPLRINESPIERCRPTQNHHPSNVDCFM